MKRVIIQEPHKIEVFEDAQPQPKVGEVLLKVAAVGICGSDLHTLEGHHPFVSYPVMPGHEVSGEIIAVGDGVPESLIGKKAVVEPSVPSGENPRFEPGRYNISSDLEVMGFGVPGGMTEYFALAVDRVHIVPDDFSHDLGVAVEPTAVAVHGVRLAGSIAGLDVAVIGAGTIGLLTAQVARIYGAANVTIAELDDSRREIAHELGFEVVTALPERSYEVVFECVGLEGALRSAMLACRKGGTVLVMGVFGNDATIPAALIQDWELRLLGSLMYIGDDYQEAIRLLSKGLVKVDTLITNRFALADAVEAFETALKRGPVLKVLLENQ